MSRQLTLFRSMVLAGTIALGAGVVWAAAWTTLGTWVTTTFFRQIPEYLDERLVFQPDGTPLVRYSANLPYMFASGPLPNPNRFRTLQGDAVDDVKDDELLAGATLNGPSQGQLPPWGLLWSERIAARSDEWRPATYWYLMHDGRDDGSAYFVGYHSVAKSVVGYIGTAGFRAEPIPTSERFRLSAGNMRDLHYRQGNTFTEVDASDGRTVYRTFVATDHGVYDVDLKNRSVRVLFEQSDQNLISVSQLGRLWSRENTLVGLLAVRTEAQVIVLDRDGKRIREGTIPAELRASGFAWYAMNDGRVVVVVDEWGMNSEGKRRSRLYFANTAGEIEKTEHLELQYFKYAAGSGSNEIALGNIAIFWVCPAAPPLDIFCGVGLLMNRGSAAGNFAAEAARFIRNYWPSLIGVHLCAVLSAWLCWRRSARYAMPQTHCVAWFLFGLFLGLPGLFGFLVHRRWPAVEECPACAERVPIDRDACAACSAAFPAPALKGVEVFA